MPEERLAANGLGNVKLIMKSFVSMGEFIPDGSASAVVFNLGYLPGGDHSITTTADETLQGLSCALKAIRPGGIVTVVLYDGHEAGAIEKKRVIKWAGELDPHRYHAAFVSLINQDKHPPEILWITAK